MERFKFRKDIKYFYCGKIGQTKKSAKNLKERNQGREMKKRRKKMIQQRLHLILMSPLFVTMIL